MENKLYANYTETLHDVLIEHPELLNIFDLGSNERNTTFKAMFVSMWDIYEIGSETYDMFKINLTNTFNQYKKYYSDMLDAYESQNITLNDLITSVGQTDFIELPNSQTNSQYTTNITKVTQTDKSQLINKRNNLLKSIRNIYEEFAYQFKECFCQIFYSGKVYENKKY